MITVLLTGFKTPSTESHLLCSERSILNIKVVRREPPQSNLVNKIEEFGPAKF